MILADHVLKVALWGFTVAMHECVHLVTGSYLSGSAMVQINTCTCRRA